MLLANFVLCLLISNSLKWKALQMGRKTIVNPQECRCLDCSFSRMNPVLIYWSSLFRHSFKYLAICVVWKVILKFSSCIMGRFLPLQPRTVWRTWPKFNRTGSNIQQKTVYLLVRQTHDFHGHGVLGCVMSGMFELESSEAPSQFYTTSKRKIYHNFFFIKSLQFTHVIL